MVPVYIRLYGLSKGFVLLKLFFLSWQKTEQVCFIHSFKANSKSFTTKHPTM